MRIESYTHLVVQGNQIPQIILLSRSQSAHDGWYWHTGNLTHSLLAHGNRKGKSNSCSLGRHITLFPNVFSYLQENKHLKERLNACNINLPRISLILIVIFLTDLSSGLTMFNICPVPSGRQNPSCVSCSQRQHSKEIDGVNTEACSSDRVPHIPFRFWGGQTTARSYPLIERLACLLAL